MITSKEVNLVKQLSSIISDVSIDEGAKAVYIPRNGSWKEVTVEKVVGNGIYIVSTSDGKRIRTNKIIHYPSREILNEILRRIILMIDPSKSIEIAISSHYLVVEDQYKYSAEYIDKKSGSIIPISGDGFNSEIEAITASILLLLEHITSAAKTTKAKKGVKIEESKDIQASNKG